MIFDIYNILIYQPILNVLVVFYKTIAFYDFGLAVIFSTIFIRLLLYPIFHKSTKHSLIMQKIQPKVEKIKELHRENKEKQLKATMELYKEHGVNPMSGIFLLFLQLPVLIALYQIFFNKLTPQVLSSLYSFVSPPGSFNTSFLGLINLEQSSILMVSLAAILQYFQGKMMLPKIEKGRKLSTPESVGRQMVYLAPILTLLIFMRMPAAISLYWTVSVAFSIFQQIIINRQLKSNEEPGKLRKEPN
ncbi:MAG: YidC/Oxa1 family membrane protein insertase [Candidatus Liptonbacteria bacterium]|nr:YidC/Oxa1 family membrane protein insertase [Candidatus Liptonbacteria bacterium]